MPAKGLFEHTVHKGSTPQREATTAKQATHWLLLLMEDLSGPASCSMDAARNRRYCSVYAAAVRLTSFFWRGRGEHLDEEHHCLAALQLPRCHSLSLFAATSYEWPLRGAHTPLQNLDTKLKARTTIYIC